MKPATQLQQRSRSNDSATESSASATTIGLCNEFENEFPSMFFLLTSSRHRLLGTERKRNSCKWQYVMRLRATWRCRPAAVVFLLDLTKLPPSIVTSNMGNTTASSVAWKTSYGHRNVLFRFRSGAQSKPGYTSRVQTILMDWFLRWRVACKVSWKLIAITPSGTF